MRYSRCINQISEKFIFHFHLLKQLFYIFNALIFLIYNPLHMLLIHYWNKPILLYFEIKIPQDGENNTNLKRSIKESMAK